MKRENNISFIHLLAAMLVIYGHQYVLLGKDIPTVLNMDCHGLGVRIIFVICGYLITKSYINSDSVLKYIWKRVVRIFPPLIFCTVVTVLIIGPLFTSLSFQEYFMYCKVFLFKNILMSPVFNLPGVFDANIYPSVVNGSLWTLPIEFMCYIVLIVFMKIYDCVASKSIKCANTYYCLVVLVFWILYIMRITGTFNQSLIIWGTDWYNSVQVAAFFFAGSLVARLNLEKYCNIQVAIILCLLSKCLGGMFLAVLYLVVITYTTLSFAFVTSPMFTKVWAQEWCYSIYLWAFPIQQVLINVLIVEKEMMLSTMHMFLLSTAVTLGVAYVSYVLVEKPFLNVKNVF